MIDHQKTQKKKYHFGLSTDMSVLWCRDRARRFIVASPIGFSLFKNRKNAGALELKQPGLARLREFDSNIQKSCSSYLCASANSTQTRKQPSDFSTSITDPFFHLRLTGSRQSMASPGLRVLQSTSLFSKIFCASFTRFKYYALSSGCMNGTVLMMSCSMEWLAWISSILMSCLQRLQVGEQRAASSKQCRQKECWHANVTGLTKVSWQIEQSIDLSFITATTFSMLIYFGMAPFTLPVAISFSSCFPNLAMGLLFLIFNAPKPFLLRQAA